MDATYKRKIRGLHSKRDGELFERKILIAELFYREKGFCFIQKTPEPMKVLCQNSGKPGTFIACFEKQAQPDVRGVLCDGSTIIFDAKHTDGDRITRQVVSAEQEHCLNVHEEFGAHCYIVVSIQFRNYYRVPWNVFRDMKEIYGHKYMNEEDLEQFKISNTGGILRFLDGIEIEEKGKA